jgi:hypothetical protein
MFLGLNEYAGLDRPPVFTHPMPSEPPVTPPLPSPTSSSEEDLVSDLANLNL